MTGLLVKRGNANKTQKQPRVRGLLHLSQRIIYLEYFDRKVFSGAGYL